MIDLRPAATELPVGFDRRLRQVVDDDVVDAMNDGADLTAKQWND